MTGVTLDRLGVVVNTDTRMPTEFHIADGPGFVKSVSNDYPKTGRNGRYANEIFLYFWVKLSEFKVYAAGSSAKPAETQGSLGIVWNEMVSGIPPMKRYQYVLSVGASKALGYVALLLYFAWCVLASVLCPPTTVISGRRVAFVRSKASEQKIRRVSSKLDISLFVEEPISRSFSGQSMFRLVSPFRLLLVFPLVIARCKADFQSLEEETGVMFSARLQAHILRYYRFRVPHACIYEALISNALRGAGRGKDLVTGNKEDRYAQIECAVCQDVGAELICIPHGLEYAYKLPAGLPGDAFYCTSVEAKTSLTTTYAQNVFVYDEEIARQMWSRDRPAQKVQAPGKAVFFTEPRNPAINFMIIKALQRTGTDFSVRLHPLEQRRSYSNLHIDFNDDLDPLHGNLCLARKSTILLEAMFKESYACAVLFDSLDEFYFFNVFPSLRHGGIHCVFCVGELDQFLRGKDV